jgi:hypothetical protein
MPYPDTMDEAATIRLALAGRSLARFGDGELKLINGRDAVSQRGDPTLASALRRILLATDTPALPCIPRLRPKGPKAEFWKQYERQPYVGFYKSRGRYGSAFVTRPDSAPHIDTPEYWALVRQLWQDKDVILVRGSGKSLTPERLSDAASVEEIMVPVQHAWTERSSLYTRLRSEKSRPVILCCGATATVLAHELAERGVHALDLGHLGMFTKRIGADGIVGTARRNDKD